MHRQNAPKNFGAAVHQLMGQGAPPFCLCFRYGPVFSFSPCFPFFCYHHIQLKVLQGIITKMAPELRSRKAKAAAVEEKAAPVKRSASVKAAKSPKTEKRKASEDASPVATKKVKASKAKKVVEEEKEEEKALTPAKGKGKKKAAAAPVEAPEPEPMDEDKEEEAPAPTPKSALKKAKANGTPASEKKQKSAAATKKSTPAKKAEEEKEEEEAAASDDEPEDEEDLDDATKALVKSFEDSGDEEGEENPVAKKNAYKKGQDVGKIPKQKKAPKSAPPAIKGKPGVIYLGRIPHGFYEHQIRAYFSQFGPITNLRLARNKKTGASRHFAFIEFEDHETADIVCRTMDNYLLFGHILKAKLIAPENVHPNLFKGANRRFKVVPWNKMQGKQLERPLSESKWAGKISKEEQRRAKRAEKLKAIGYEFEPPALKAAEAKEVPAAIEEGKEDAAIEDAPAPAAIEAPAEEEKVEEPAGEEEEEKAKETPVKKSPAAKKGSAAKAKKGRRSSTK
ncbi:RNA-binding domain containing protein [Naviculisporaceae sp. PSN 640]